MLLTMKMILREATTLQNFLKDLESKLLQASDFSFLACLLIFNNIKRWAIRITISLCAHTCIFLTFQNTFTLRIIFPLDKT